MLKFLDSAPRGRMHARMTFSLVASLGSIAIPCTASSNLVAGAIDSTQRAEVARATPATLAAQTAPAADEVIEHLGLSLRRSAQRQTAFERLLREQQDPTSPNFHRWLSADEIGERFGATRDDIDALSNWLNAQGLHVDAVSNARMRIDFSGRAADVAAAFETELKYAQVGKKTKLVNTANATLPAALATAVHAVIGLRPIEFHSAQRHSAPQVMQVGKRGGGPQGSFCDSDPCDHVVFPEDFTTIYGMASTPANTATGGGETIAIIGRARVYDPDIHNFQVLAGVPLRAATVVVPPGAVDPGDPASSCSTTGTPSCADPGDAVLDQFEATLDVQLAGAAAPGANIKLIVATDTSTANGIQQAIEYAIDSVPVPAKVMSISFGSCEADNDPAVMPYLDNLFGQAAAEGITVLVSSGDSGAADCADHTAPPPATQSRGINALCASGHVTCVGGTQFADTAHPELYWRPNNSADFGSAIGYIPEGAWNEPVGRTGASAMGGTGGGISTHIAKPSWQLGFGDTANSGRNTPDVAFTASQHDGYFTCMAAQQGSCAVVSGSFHFLVSSGTSASAPGMAGIAARLNQFRSGAQGNLNPRLYALAAHSSNGVFHDVTPATSGVAHCDLAVPSPCNNSTAGPSSLAGGLQGYAVAGGYDQATGLGSIAVNKLLPAWGGALVPGVVLNQHGISGSWANPATQSQGILMTVDPDFFSPGGGLLFGGWFAYGEHVADGPRWFTIQGEVSGTEAVLPVYATTGGRLGSAQATTTNPVGTATLHFSDCSTGTLDYNINSADFSSLGSIPLTRLLPNVTCGMNGPNGSSGGRYLLSGVWADTATNGQGFVFDLNPSQHVFFGAWYTYPRDGSTTDDASAQRWYTLQATLPSTTTINAIPIYESHGGAFNQSAATTTTAVGNATLTFHSCASATLTYTFTGGANAGDHGTLELSRLTPAPTGCHL